MKKVERYSSPLQSTRVHTCASFQGVKTATAIRQTNNSEERTKGRAVVVGGEFVLHRSKSGWGFSPANREIVPKWTPLPVKKSLSNSPTGSYNRWPSFIFLVSRYFSLCGFAAVRIGTCSTISRP